MSQTLTPNDSVSQSSDRSQVRGKPTTQKRTNKTKLDARSKFNPSAPSISAEKFFTEFVEKKRNNVEIVFDVGVQSRIADIYVTKARNHAINKYQSVNNDLQCSTFALISIALCRKLLLSTPDSEEYEVGRFRSIWKTELMAPKSAIAAISNVGKFEFEDKVARLKYSSQDVFRMLLTTCKVMNQHSSYRNNYATGYHDADGEVGWDDVDTTRCVITSESSVRWLRDEAIKFLDVAYMNTWQVDFSPPPTPEVPDPPIIAMEVSYPRLKIVDDADKQLQEVVAWLGRLHAGMPGVQYVIAAGFATAWKLVFFQRVGHLFSNLVRGLPDWINNRPIDVLTTLGLHHYDLSTDDYDGLSYFGFIHEIHNHVLTNTAFYSEFLELAKQPDDKFGTAAQMIPYNRTDFAEAVFVGLPLFTYERLKSDAQAITVVKLQDRGAVTAGLTFGFARDVKIVPNFIGRLNGDPNNIRTQYLKPDLKLYN